jgi:hypothetical protein
MRLIFVGPGSAGDKLQHLLLLIVNWNKQLSGWAFWRIKQESMVSFLLLIPNARGMYVSLRSAIPFDTASSEGNTHIHG